MTKHMQPLVKLQHPSPNIIRFFFAKSNKFFFLIEWFGGTSPARIGWSRLLTTYIWEWLDSNLKYLCHVPECDK